MEIAIIGAAGHFELVIWEIKKGTAINVKAVARGCKEEDISSLLLQLEELCICPKVYDDYRELLAAERCDFIVVNTWFGLGAGVTVDCMKHGFDVYAEKPLATGLQDLRELEQVWKETGRQLGCMLTGRNEPWFRTVSLAVRNGDIGELRLIHAQKSYQRRNQPDFYQIPRLFGGLIPWVGIHALDWIMTLCGEDAEILKMQSCRSSGTPELTAAFMLFLEKGIISTAACDYLRPDSAGTHGDDRVRVAGTKGVIEAVAGRVTLINHEGSFMLPVQEWVNPFLEYARLREAGKTEGFGAYAIRITRIALELQDF